MNSRLAPDLIRGNPCAPTLQHLPHTGSRPSLPVHRGRDVPGKEGALAQGIGYALYEKLESDRGRIQNTNFRDYKIPTIQEMNFPIDLEFIETEDEFGPFGAKGVAEPGLVPTAPAIANAVYDAVGVRIRGLPIMPEKVLAALKNLKQIKD